jgi:hypothetical protein
VRFPESVALGAVALAFAGLAVLAGPEYGLVDPLAAAAVAAAALALVPIVLGDRAPARLAMDRKRIEPGGIRTWLRSGTVGREEIVLLLDRLDRSGPRPELPSRPPAEIARLVSLSAGEFRAYVERRMDEIEAGA